MANIKRMNEDRFPVLFGEKTRPSSIVENKDELLVEGQAFENYAPKAGTMYRFTTYEDAIIKKQAVNEGGNNYQFLILCEASSDGGKTWHDSVLSINSFGKRDADNQPVHPTWYALGNIGARAKKLCEMGEITVGTAARKIKVPVFDKGKPVQEIARDDNGAPIVDENNQPRRVTKTRFQDVYDITPVA